MTPSERDKLLIETHGYVRELKIIVTGTNGGGHEKRLDVLEVMDKSLVDRLASIEKNMVTQTACMAVQDKQRARGRSKWIVAKDVVLIVLPTATLIAKMFGAF